MQEGAVIKINQNYNILADQQLGRGAFGIVYKGFSKLLNSFVAIKQLTGSVEKIWRKNPQLKRQVEIMQKLKHKNILNLLDFIETKQSIYIIIQFCAGGDLKSQLKKQGKLSQLTTFKYLIQIVQAMVQVNNQKYLHRDIKPENILISETGTLKIADFGLARRVIGDDIVQLKAYTAKYTPLYAAPNVLMGQQYSAKCDVWSAGVLVYQLLTGKALFSQAKNIYNLVSLQKAYENKPFQLGENYNIFFKNILKKMIAFNEDDRITFKQLENEINVNKAQILHDLGDIKVEKKIKIKNHTPYQVVQKHPSNAAILTQSMIIEKKIDERIYQDTLILVKYVEFIYTRCLLYKDVEIKLNKITFPPVSFHKYLIMFLLSAIYISDLQELNKFLSHSLMKFPCGKVIQLFTNNKNDRYTNQIKTSIDGFLKHFETECQKMIQSIDSIHKKISSAVYKQKYISQMKSEEEIMNELENVHQKKKFKNQEYYMELYTASLKKYCQIDLKNADEQLLRIFNFMIEVPTLKKTLNEDKYQVMEQINKFKENLNKQPQENLIKKIQKWNSLNKK